ncbi:MAG TPA: amino acid ABC transporter permease [Gammaproteobacteria bacterium]|nr:amino acid ABC transporter permease [Gammaproteobacteria bacterium]
MNFDWSSFVHYLFVPSSVYLYGLFLTVSLSVISEASGVVIGTAVALARLSRFRSVDVAMRFYIWLFRGTPLLVQIIFFYTALAAANVFRFHQVNLGFMTIPGNIQAGVVALSLHEGAYMAEIVRAGIDSVPKGQLEAGRSLGLSYAEIMRHVVLPQAARFVIPPVGNQFNLMLKNTSLLSVIGVPELLFTTETMTSVTFQVFELYSVVALYYLTLTTIWGFVQKGLERKYGDHTAVDKGSAGAAGLKGFLRWAFS